MHTLNFEEHISDKRPSLLDTDSSPTTVFIRRNIETFEEYFSETDETKIMYRFEEASMPVTDYINYVTEKNKADIEYVFMMEGLDYEEQ